MEPRDLPSDFETTQVYSGVKRILTSNSEDQGVLYRGKRGSHSIIIRQNFDNADAHCFKMCEEHNGIYLLTSLECYSPKERHFFVYEKYASLDKWMQDKRNIVQNDRFTHQFIQILR